jgi:hypothetical protein
MGSHAVIQGASAMKNWRVAVAGVWVLGLSGCITKTAVLTNDQGQTQTCEKEGRVGIFSQYVLNKRFESCVEKAKKDGYKETAPTSSGSK